MTWRLALGDRDGLDEELAYRRSLPPTKNKQVDVVQLEALHHMLDGRWDDAMAAIKAAGRDWVWLLVSDKNLRALAFYAKYDFTRIGTGETIYVGRDTLPSSILARRI